MIDEYYTWIFYGYHSDELSKGSHKPIIAVCDECGKYRVSEKKSHRDLCRSCAQFNRFLNIKEHEKLSFAQKKHYQNNPNRVETQRLGTLKRYEDPKERMKQSKIQKNHYLTHPERAKRHSKFMMGNKMSDAAKLKSSKAQRNIPMSKIAKERLSATHQNISHNEWEGFIKFKPYCYKFNESLKQSIRDRYNNCDYISGIHKNICNKGRSLDVHHVDYNKQQGCDNHQWKLIPLSRSNHAKTNMNRSFWNRLFTYSLQYEAEYYGDE